MQFGIHQGITPNRTIDKGHEEFPTPQTPSFCLFLCSGICLCRGGIASRKITTIAKLCYIGIQKNEHLCLAEKVVAIRSFNFTSKCSVLDVHNHIAGSGNMV